MSGVFDTHSLMSSTGSAAYYLDLTDEYQVIDYFGLMDRYGRGASLAVNVQPPTSGTWLRPRLWLQGWISLQRCMEFGDGSPRAVR